jgi:hypothetical protein
MNIQMAAKKMLSLIVSQFTALILLPSPRKAELVRQRGVGGEVETANLPAPPF